jgi:hypothetical protein
VSVDFAVAVESATAGEVLVHDWRTSTVRDEPKPRSGTDG